MIEYLDILIGGLVVLGIVKWSPTRWFSKEERIRYEAAKRLKEKLR